MIEPACAQADALWFARLGLPLRPAEARDAHAYLAALGYPCELPVRVVAGWEEAQAVACDPEWDQAWWTREEAERERLMEVAARSLGRTALLQQLTQATRRSVHAIHEAAVTAAQRAGAIDPALPRAASGAAAMALHAAELARLTGAGPEHPFVRKYALLASGRWPLGIVRGAFYVF